MKLHSFSGMHSEKTKENGQKAKQGKFWLNIKKKSPWDSVASQRDSQLFIHRGFQNSAEEHPE